LREDEAASLFHLARSRTPSSDPVIVELGAGPGKSTLLLAAGLSGKTSPKLFCFGGTGGQCRLHRRFERCRLEHILDLSDDHPRAAAANWKHGIDILFIKASDDDAALRDLLLLWSPFVKSGGIVALQAVSAASYTELLITPQHSDFRLVDSLAWAVQHCGVTPVITSLDSAAQDFVRRASREFAENRHAIRALQRSWSWRLTAPLRWTAQMLQALGGLLGLGGLVSSAGGGSPKARMVGLAQWLWFGKQVRASGLFDARYYRDCYPGVAWARSSPLLHFFVCGAGEGHKPNELFDVEYYLARYPDVASSRLNPLVHYLRNGANEGRDPHPHFDSSFYLEQNPDVREEGLNPLAHYLAPGIAEGRDPNPWFDTSEYLEQNPEVAVFGLNPLAHYAEVWSKS
jgi:predicted O-methyltransferase YrrM